MLPDDANITGGYGGGTREDSCFKLRDVRSSSERRGFS